MYRSFLHFDAKILFICRSRKFYSCFKPTCSYNHLVQRVIPNSPASFTSIQLNEILVIISLHSCTVSLHCPSQLVSQLEVDGIDVSKLDTDSVRRLIVGAVGSSVELLLSLTGRLSLKRTQLVQSPRAPPSPPQAPPAVLSSPCFPSKAEVEKRHFSGEAEEDC